jgi:sec-independent protein translocase protein TatA
MEMATILAFGLGAGEIALIIFALVLLFGAKKIPELARGLGKGIREFKDASKDVRSEIEKAGDEANK